MLKHGIGLREFLNRCTGKQTAVRVKLKVARDKRPLERLFEPCTQL